MTPLSATLSWLERSLGATVIVLTVLLTLLIGYADVRTGAVISLSIFYFLPVGAMAWRCGRGWALAGAFISGATWLFADWSTLPDTHPGILFWNAAVRTAVFMSFALVVNELRRRHEHERELARTDGLTSVANSRCFAELANREIARTRRSKRPISLLYFDCDDFKSINDRFGHSRGNDLLRTIAATLTERTRPTDVVARLGGDEFVVLLPETGAPAALTVAEHLRSDLADAVLETHADVTFSVGCVTFDQAPLNVDQLINAADTLMYEAKGKGKNRLTTGRGDPSASGDLA